MDHRLPLVDGDNRLRGLITVKDFAKTRDYPLATKDPEGRLVVGVVNLPPRQIGPVLSEVLVLGAVSDSHPVLLLEPDAGAEPGDLVA